MFTISILLLIATIVTFFVLRNTNLSFVPYLCGTAMLLALALSCIYQVPDGTTGVEVLFGKVVGYEGEGLHTKTPLSKVKLFSKRTVVKTFKTQAPTADQQQITMVCTVRFHIAEDEIGKLFSKKTREMDRIDDVCVDPDVESAIKAQTVKYGRAEVLSKRESIQNDTEENLGKMIAKNYVILEAFRISDIALSVEYNKAVEEKQVEEQRVITMQNKTRQAEEEKKQNILKAEAKAEAFRVMKVSLSKEKKKKKWIEKWDGSLSKVAGAGSGLIIDISNLK